MRRTETAAKSSTGALQDYQTPADKRDRFSTGLISSRRRKATDRPSSANVAKSRGSDEDEIQTAAVKPESRHFYHGGKEKSPRGRSGVLQSGRCTQSTDFVKHSCVPRARRACQMCDMKPGREHRMISGRRRTIGEIQQQLADEGCTQSASDRAKLMKPASSYLLHAKTPSIQTAQHSKVTTIYDQTRPYNSDVQTPTATDVNARGRQLRTVTVSTQTCPSSTSDRLRDSAASCFLQMIKDQAAKQSCVSTTGTSFQKDRGAALSSVCSCPCHKQPTSAPRRHEPRETEQTTVSDTQFRRISSGLGPGARGKETEGGGGTFSRKMKTSGRVDSPKDSDEDIESESHRNLQRLQSAMANRLHIHVSLFLSQMQTFCFMLLFTRVFL